jgi:hypothetical protein
VQLKKLRWRFARDVVDNFEINSDSDMSPVSVIRWQCLKFNWRLERDVGESFEIDSDSLISPLSVILSHC